VSEASQVNQKLGEIRDPGNADGRIPDSAEGAIHPFGGKADAHSYPDSQLLGGKGANLAEMASLGLPVPPGFTISARICARYETDGDRALQAIGDDLERGKQHIESIVGKRFGDPYDPLLLSVRSGSRVSMPGMMDTVLNLGLNDSSVLGLAHISGNERFAWDSYRRFIQMYSDVVLGLDRQQFEELLHSAKAAKGVQQDTDLDAADLKALATAYKRLAERLSGTAFPQNVSEQLSGAIAAVFRSWNCERAKVYRRLNNIPNSWGTAVTVQAMVFGNMGATSATGVAFTRNPSTGEQALYGEYLLNAQGEDVVAGIRTPQPLARENGRQALDGQSLEETMPDVFTELARTVRLLERHNRDMQDVEFTVERGRLWLLQTRSGKRSAKAAIKIAVDMVQEGLITESEAVSRIDPLSLDQLLHPTINRDVAHRVIAKGLPASPGAASGRIVFDANSAERAADAGEKVILVRTETCPEDIQGMHAAAAILTVRGGMTSHAAVVARGMGRPCVSGAGAISIDHECNVMRVGDLEVGTSDLITLDGSTGEVILGELPTIPSELPAEIDRLSSWADRCRRLRVRANADTAEDCRIALGFGAEGVGLCRTEHMFFDEHRITTVREMILADSKSERSDALARLLPEQRKDFTDIFRIMGSLPVTIRLLDPPLHEFLPHKAEEFMQLAKAANLNVEALTRRASDLAEINPMLGHRGCRLGITCPEIYEMQVRAIFEAAVATLAETGVAPTLEIMVPLIATAAELKVVRAVIDCTARTVFAEQGISVDYLVGTMIELPRAALCAGDIAKDAHFFSFGTNDLTQTALGVSRDDAGKFLPRYIDDGLLPVDPFVTLDEDGVGELVASAAQRGREVHPGLKLGVCGEHGGDPVSIHFFEHLGLDYVSASPYRIMIARFAAAQAAIGKSADSNKRRRKADLPATPQPA